jgi:hypothetical protein
MLLCEGFKKHLKETGGGIRPKMSVCDVSRERLIYGDVRLPARQRNTCSGTRLRRMSSGCELHRQMLRD